MEVINWELYLQIGYMGIETTHASNVYELKINIFFSVNHILYKIEKLFKTLLTKSLKLTKLNLTNLTSTDRYAIQGE